MAEGKGLVFGVCSEEGFLTGNGHLGRRCFAIGELVQLAAMSVNGHETCSVDRITHWSNQRPPRAD